MQTCVRNRMAVKGPKTGHMTSTKNSQGFPIAILRDCLLPLRSCGMLAMFRGDGSRVTRRALAKLALSESLPLPAGLPDFPLSFRLLPEALLPTKKERDLK